MTQCTSCGGDCGKSCQRENVVETILIPRKLLQTTLETLEQINRMSLPPMNIALPAEIDYAMDELRAVLEMA